MRPGILSSGKSRLFFQHDFSKYTTISSSLGLVMLCLRMCCLGVVQLYLLNKTFWWQRMHIMYFPFFPATPCGGGATHKMVVLIVHKEGPHPSFWCVAHFSLARLLLLCPFDLHSRLPPPLPSFPYYSSLLRATRLPCKFSLAVTPQDIVLHVETVILFLTILLLLLLLELQPTATRSTHY